PNSLKILFLSEHYYKAFSFNKRKLSDAVLVDNEILSFFMLENVKNGKLTETLNESDSQKFSEFLRIFDNNYDTKSAINYIRKCIRDLENPNYVKKMTDLLGLRYY
ncbi:MAG: hypothetical protein P0116_15115, partial [Candidatus Nitrosocosmicus sp.]|nr:hypothetical protein [Candidatus Nitrosocosmicus sp.]